MRWQLNKQQLRATFDEVILPIYAPAEFIPVKGQGQPESGINRARSMSISRVALQLRRWAIAILRW